MKQRMEELLTNLTEAQRVAILFMLLGLAFFAGGLLQWLENQ